MTGAAISAEPVRFAGYAAIFDRLDNGGDVIAPGAFAASLARLGGRRCLCSGSTATGSGSG